MTPSTPLQAFGADSRFELVQVLYDIRTANLCPHATYRERPTWPCDRKGRPPLRAAFDEVGLKHSGLRRVGGPT